MQPRVNLQLLVNAHPPPVMSLIPYLLDTTHPRLTTSALSQFMPTHLAVCMTAATHHTNNLPPHPPNQPMQPMQPTVNDPPPESTHHRNQSAPQTSADPRDFLEDGPSISYDVLPATSLMRTRMDVRPFNPDSEAWNTWFAHFQEATRLPPLVPLSDNLSDIRRVQENAGHLPDPHPDNILMYLCEAQQLLRAAEQSSALLSVAVPAVRATVAALGASAEAAKERFDSAETAIARWGKAIRDLGESQQLAATRLGRCQALEAQVSDLRGQLAGLRSGLAPPTAAPTPQPLPSAPAPLNRQEGANIIRGVLQRLTPEDAITTAEAMLAWAVTLH